MCIALLETSPCATSIYNDFGSVCWFWGQLTFRDSAIQQAIKKQGLHIASRGVTGGWAEWAIAQPDFDRIVGTTGQRRRAALLLAHPAFGSQLRPWL